MSNVSCAVWSASHGNQVVMREDFGPVDSKVIVACIFLGQLGAIGWAAMHGAARGIGQRGKAKRKRVRRGKGGGGH